MSVWPRILLIIGSGLLSGPVAADVVEVSVLEWGPLMPLGVGESGHMLFDSGPTVKLDEHLISVDVVHTEERDVDTTVEGRRKTIKMIYYFVRIRVDKDGARKLRDIQKLVEKRKKKPIRKLHSIQTSVRIAGGGQGDRIFFNNKSETAELRLVLFEKQLLPLLGAVKKAWKDAKQKSTVNLWTSGEIDVITPSSESNNDG